MSSYSPSYHARYYRDHRHKWVDANKDDHMPYLGVPEKLTDDDRVRQYSDWFTRHDGSPAPVFFSEEQLQRQAAEHRNKMQAMAESSSFRNALYLNNLKHYMATGDEMPGAEKKWFGVKQ
jgi:hypothetical protein